MTACPICYFRGKTTPDHCDEHGFVASQPIPRCNECAASAATASVRVVDGPSLFDIYVCDVCMPKCDMILPGTWRALDGSVIPGAWGKGFVLAISKRWKLPEERYRALRTFDLGHTQWINVESDIAVVNMIAQTLGGPHPLSYDALRLCLQGLNGWCEDIDDATIHMPRIGCGLGGGSWSKVEPLIIDTISKPVYVYDLP